MGAISGPPSKTIGPLRGPRPRMSGAPRLCRGVPSVGGMGAMRADVEGATALPGRPERWGYGGHAGGCRGRHGFAGASRASGVWGPSRGPHSNSRLAHERGAAHVARLVHGERPGAVHGTTVVPHHEVAHAPRVGVHELALRGVLREITQEGARLRHRPADDAARVRREIERLPSGRRMGAHQALAHRLEARTLLLGEVEEAELLAREDLRVLADQ